MAGPKMKALALKLWRSWMTRSLAVGGVATILDLVVGVTCLSLIALPTRVSAMVGVAIGATFTFFANRYFAFKEKNPKLTKPAIKFVIATVVSMVIHGQFVLLMRDRAGVPFVPAKMIADVAVFSLGQLFVLRYLVFGKPKTEADPAPVAVLEPAEPSFAPAKMASES